MALFAFDGSMPVRHRTGATAPGRGLALARLTVWNAPGGGSGRVVETPGGGSGRVVHLPGGGSGRVVELSVQNLQD